MSMSIGAGTAKGKRHRPTPEINVTPLVDVMLVLLVIFMITVQAVKESIPMELPQAAGNVDEAKTALEVSVDEYGKVHTGNNTLELAQVDDELPRILAGREKEQLTFNAHRKLPYETVVKVVAAIRSAGIETIHVCVDPGR